MVLIISGIVPDYVKKLTSVVVFLTSISDAKIGVFFYLL